MSRILLVDDEPSILSVLSTLMVSQGHEAHPVLGGDKALELLHEEAFDLMISDIRMSPIDGMELLRSAKARHPGMAVIMCTGYGSVESAVEAMKLGAFDYVTKPFKVDELVITVQRALEFRSALAENKVLKAQLQAQYTFDNLVAQSPHMRKVCDMIVRVAPTDQTVLISGESGSGKEVIAKAIHAHSVRKKKPFIAINCAALPEALLESELFGHAKGAFTGASSEKKGLFEEGHGGTVFLDEIGSMPLSLQSKLLRVLQEKEIRKVGGNDTISVDVRLLAASNENLDEMIKAGTFREDLYYRLSVIPIHLLGLRDRREDILPLVDYFLRNIHGGNGELPELAPEAQAVLESYDWPGNVRELENAIRHAVTFARDGIIRVEDLPAKVGNTASVDASRIMAELNAAQGQSLKMFLRQKEKEYISNVIGNCDGDKDKAAKELKISLATLYRKLPEPSE